MVNGITVASQAANVAAAYNTDAKQSGKTTDKTSGAFTDKAAVYESSATDNKATIKKLKEEADAQTEQLRQLVEKMLLKQGEAATGGKTLWNKLADGGVIPDDEAKAKATEDISENGYWGVDQTSDRILSFASALAGNDPEKMKTMLSAFEKGYKQATKAWGSELPDISKQTYQAVQDKFSKWFEDNETNS